MPGLPAVNHLDVACEVCGCSDYAACPGGCSWDPDYAAAGHAVCSQCALRLDAAARLGMPPQPYVLLLGAISPAPGMEVVHG